YAIWALSIALAITLPTNSATAHGEQSPYNWSIVPNSQRAHDAVITRSENLDCAHCARSFPPMTNMKNNSESKRNGAGLLCSLIFVMSALFISACTKQQVQT